MSERRRWKRILLGIKGRPSFHCLVDIAALEPLACTLLDISCGGVRLEVRKGLDLPHLVDGQGVEFADFDAPRLAFLKGRRGMVTWYRPGERQFGVAFQDILRKGQVEGLLEP